MYDERQMASHYQKLKKIMTEKKPNPQVVSQLLDLEFKARRHFIETVKGSLQHRIDSILSAYPCFSSPVHVRPLYDIYGIDFCYLELWGQSFKS